MNFLNFVENRRKTGPRRPIHCKVNVAIIMMTTVVNCESQTLPFSHMMWVKISPTRSVCEVQLPPTAV